MGTVSGPWIVGGGIGLACFFAGRIAVRWAIKRIVGSRAAASEGTWQHDLREQMLREGPRVEANIYYFVSFAVIFFCFAIAALFSAVPVWLGVLGLTMAVLGVASAESWVRYGNGKHVRQVMRRWLRIPERPRYR